jgi:hypothetical protein
MGLAKDEVKKLRNWHAAFPRVYDLKDIIYSRNSIPEKQKTLFFSRFRLLF